jgi:ketosteroid isomerase-like protein
MQKSASHAIAVALLFFSLTLVAGRALAGAEQDVDQIEDRRYAAMIAGDLAALAPMLADEFTYHQPTGSVATKASYIEQLKSGAVKIYEARRYNVTIHVYGDIATAMGMTHLDLERKGARSDIELRYLNVWVLRDGRWQLAARQSAFVPK